MCLNDTMDGSCWRCPSNQSINALLRSNANIFYGMNDEVRILILPFVHYVYCTLIAFSTAAKTATTVITTMILISYSLTSLIVFNVYDCPSQQQQQQSQAQGQ